MLILIVFLLFILLFLLPFLPGIIELIRKKDADPLYIPMDYIKDPRYFGKSFKRLLHLATEKYMDGPGIRYIQLSKQEKIEIAESMDITAGQEIHHLLYVKGDLVSAINVRINKEAYVTGNASIGPNNILHVLAADGNISLAAGTHFQRWLDANGDIDIGTNCSLGISVSTGSKLSLAKNCHFRRLYGMPISTGKVRTTAMMHFELSLPQAEPLQTVTSFIRKKDRLIPPGTIMINNVVFPQDVQIGYGSIFKGNIKSYGKLVLEENVTIDGNIFADGDIMIGRGGNISGHVFSQQSIYISEHSVISRPATVKSIVGKKSVSIEQNVIIYGYVTTEGSGAIV